MFLRLLIYLFGIVLTSTGFMFILIYASVFGNDVNFFSYLGYFLTRIEIYLIPLGLFLIVITAFFDYKWYTINRFLKDNRKRAKNNYKEFVRNDKRKKL